MLNEIVCPKTKSKLRYDDSRLFLISEEASLAYPVRNGIPILLINEAYKIVDGAIVQNEINDIENKYYKE